MLIVLVGVRGAGKSTLLGKLASNVIVLKPSTTRQPRDASDSEYDFVSSWRDDLYAWKIAVSSNTYGMRVSEVGQAIDGICATVFDPLNLSVLEDYRRNSKIEILTVGLNTVQSQEEQLIRVGSDPSRVMKYNEFTRAVEAVLGCDLVISGEPDVLAEAIVATIRLLTGRGGKLVKQDIEALIKAGVLVQGGTISGIKPASYDIRLGGQIWCQGKLHEIGPASTRFDIPPYSYAIVVAKEAAALPTFITGTFDLKVSMFLSGVILSNGPQIDPGYRGQLFCMLFNGSSNPRTVLYDTHFATIEFSTTSRPTEAYRQQYQLINRLDEILGEGAMGSPGGTIIERIGTVEAAVRDGKATVRNSIIAVGGLCLAAIALPGAIFLTMLWDRVKGAEEVIAKARAFEKQLEDVSIQQRAQSKVEVERAAQEAASRAQLSVVEMGERISRELEQRLQPLDQRR